MPPAKDNSWTIADNVRERVLRHTAEGYPREACGILLCSIDRPMHITGVLPTDNVTPEDSSRRYLIAPNEFIEAQKWADEKSAEICGFYHSHPDHPSRPSEYDRETAWEGYLYLILSLRNGVFHNARAWQMDEEGRNFEEAAVFFGGGKSWCGPLRKKRETGGPQ